VLSWRPGRASCCEVTGLDWQGTGRARGGNGGASQGLEARAGARELGPSLGVEGVERGSWRCSAMRDSESDGVGGLWSEPALAGQGPALAGGLALAGLRPAFSGSDFFEKFCSRCSSNWAQIGR
jgi:hypothetical protein